jgi:O-methyltransferase
MNYLSIYKQFQQYTMVGKERYITNLQLVEIFKPVPGVIVECGAWKGGMIAGIAMILGDDREYLLFDSFEGLPPAREIDGEHALKWQADKTSPYYYNNCTADEKDAVDAMKMSGVTKYKIIKGWFIQTLSSLNFDKNIAILRLDGDWYDSTMQCLEALFHHVHVGGLIIIDDYYDWDGCSKAVHDYLSGNQRSERIYQANNIVCYLVKR